MSRAKHQREELLGTFARKHSMNQKVLKKDTHLHKRFEREQRRHTPTPISVPSDPLKPQTTEE